MNQYNKWGWGIFAIIAAVALSEISMTGTEITAIRQIVRQIIVIAMGVLIIVPDDNS